jgi:hypothetical protein
MFNSKETLNFAPIVNSLIRNEKENLFKLDNHTDAAG